MGLLLAFLLLVSVTLAAAQEIPKSLIAPVDSSLRTVRITPFVTSVDLGLGGPEIDRWNWHSLNKQHSSYGE